MSKVNLDTEPLIVHIYSLAKIDEADELFGNKCAEEVLTNYMKVTE